MSPAFLPGTCLNQMTNPQAGGQMTNKWQEELGIFYNEIKNDKRFIFPGYVQNKDLIGLYQNARCNILVFA